MSRHQVQIQVDSSGDATVVERCRGEEILGVEIERGTWGNAVDVTVTETLTGTVVYDADDLTADKESRTRVLAHDTDGAALVADAGPPAVDQVLLPVICYESLTIVIAGAVAQSVGDVIIITRSS